MAPLLGYYRLLSPIIAKSRIFPGPKSPFTRRGKALSGSLRPGLRIDAFAASIGGGIFQIMEGS
jgi:hypothetical protein